MFLFTLATFASTPVVYAASDEGDDILEESASDKGKKKSSSRDGTPQQVKEIVRGFYAKSDVGGAMYLGKFAQFVNSGTFVSLGVGQDFIDQERMSMAWELAVDQGLHNGLDYGTQGSLGCGVGAPCTEGDLRTYTAKVLIEYSYYPSRRVGIGARAGGGVLYSPLLMNKDAYATILTDDFGVDPGLHDAPHPVVGGGLTMEYYTKLSHFSVGVDVDVMYGIGWDLGADFAGYLKYTF